MIWYRLKEVKPADQQMVLTGNLSKGDCSYSFSGADYWPAIYHADDGDAWWYDNDCGMGEYWTPFNEPEVKE